MAILLAALAVVFLPLVSGAEEDGCEVPLFVKQNQSTANVMILADNSGSMNAALYHEDYNQSIRWTGRFVWDSTYNIGRDGYYTPSSWNRRWESSPSVKLVNSDNGQNGRYEGNYLNWLFYHASNAQRAGAPTMTRIQVLKVVLDQILERSERLDFGLTIFDSNSDGGRVMAGCGSSTTAMRTQVSNMTANTWTPLGESMEDILDYFGDKYDSPIESSCQYNFVLMVTDGLPTMDRSVSGYLFDADGDGNEPGTCASIGAPHYPASNDCSDHVDDVAWWMANRDVNDHVDGDQHVYSYVVGFNEDAQLLNDTAINGQGLYFTANTAVDLFLSIEYALQDILRRISSGSAVAVVSTERGTNDRLYRGKFMPVDWDGYLESFDLPYHDNDRATWEAGEFLRTRNPSTRNIFTGIGNRRYAFAPGNAGELMETMGVADEDQAADLINWGIGYDVEDLRDRHGWVLGPIVHSTPVVVGPPAQFVMEESYSNFRQNHQYRRKMVYVGANDGMLHGFDAETGNEEWAFVPEFALPVFEDMADSAYCHKFTCDQTASVADVRIDGSWRTVLSGGGGAGGSSIFALDVTYPDAPDLLWQADLPNGKKHHSELEVVMIADVPVALVGSGLDKDDMEASLYAFNMETGELLGDAVLSEGGYTPRNMATRPVIIDLNLDGSADLIYVADMLGSLWRIKTNGNYNPSGWDISELYEGYQEITADPVVAYGKNGAIYVYFGTGAYIEDEDMETMDSQSFLCVFDRHDGRTASKNSMANQTDTIQEMGEVDGWYVELWNGEGERVTQQAAVVAETVIFTSFAPTGDVCVAGGQSWLYQMRYGDGGRSGEDEGESDDTNGRSVDLGEGIASYPVVDLAAGTVVVQSSDASIEVHPIGNNFQRLSVRAWQEVFGAGNEETPGDITGDLQ